MSVMDYANEPNMTLWDAYKAECKAEGIQPSIKDYMMWLQEAELDQKDLYEGNDVG